MGALDGARPDFGYTVPPGGYTWWYIDALSDDGRDGITLIAFIGSVFSPYYVEARRARGGAAEPRDHCAFNIALYGSRRGHWAMTERDRHALTQHADRLAIGPSELRWEGGALIAEFAERTTPKPGEIRGRLRVEPQLSNSEVFALAADGRHRWRPLAPQARIEVALERPELSWSGTAYVDTNAGDEPLEAGFSHWQWSRAIGPNGTLVFYDVVPRSAAPFTLALRWPRSGAPQRCSELPAATPLPKTWWGIERSFFADTPGTAKVQQTLEDTPFYSRSVVASPLYGEPLVAVHESLSMRRFVRGAVQWMLPWRMPRVTA
ncbi:hypothetical protein CKO15_07905 [Halorhodospira abdelmalekii]|nr:hypothetical protein [Halorhodospira abdelmalekii]